jgi:protein-tyrosine phosphatase
MLHHPDRLIALEGASNFRDLGGYAGQDGRPLRWRRVFRSDHLAGLSAADQARLQALSIRRALDFRGVEERAAAVYRLPGVDQHALSIEPTVMQRMRGLADQGQAITPAVTAGLMQDLYRSFVDADAPAFAAFFRHLLQADEPLVFHCTAGKDRTGFAAALLLLALGVPRDLVLQDYLLSNQHYRRPPPAADSPVPPEVLTVVWTVQASFLDAALQAIDARHGGVKAFVAGRLGLGADGLAQLADRYLDAA